MLTTLEREKREEAKEQEEWAAGRTSSIIRQKEESFLTLDVFGVDDILSSNLFGFSNEDDNDKTGAERVVDREYGMGGGAVGGAGAAGGAAGGGVVVGQERTRTPAIELTPRASQHAVNKGHRTGRAPCGELQEGSGGSSTGMRVWLNVRQCCNKIIDCNLSVRSFVPFLFKKKDQDVLISPFALFFSVFRIVLAVQLVRISGHNGSLPWLRVGWVVQTFLMLESVILISALGFNQYLRLSGASFSFVLNWLSLLFMLAVGTSAEKQGQPVFILLLVVQVFRFFRSFRFLRDYDFMMSLVPLIVRMLLLYFSIIYFFAVIGHTRLCHSFPSDIDSQDVDDDGASWEEFSSLLNFSTLLKTVFTLYEVSILGNWSIVMGAASREEPILAFLFFLPYRLLMAMLVIPLLFSFIMQAFISHRDKLARKEIVVDKLATYSKLDRYFYSDMIDDEGRAEDPEQIKRSVDDAVEKIMKKNEEASAIMRTQRNSVRKIQRRASMRSINLSKSFMDIAEGNFFGPDISIPTLQSQSTSENSNDVGKKAIRSGEKGQSMMSFWSGGVQGPSTLHRDQRNAAVLASMLEEALFQLGKTLDDKADTLITLDALKERGERMAQQQFTETSDSENDEEDEYE